MSTSGVVYECKIHGTWDALKESGCPTCVAEMRKEMARTNKILRGVMDEMDLPRTMHACSTCGQGHTPRDRHPRWREVLEVALHPEEPRP